MNKLYIALALCIMSILLGACGAKAPQAVDQPKEGTWQEYEINGVSIPVEETRPVQVSDYIFIDAEVIWSAGTHTDLLDAADVVVRGYLLDDSYEKHQLMGDQVVYGNTYSTLVVDQVYKGSPKDTSILYAEPTWTSNGVGYAQNDYLPCQKGKEYIFFLKQAEHEMFDGAYYPVSGILGRYATDRNTAAQASLEAYTEEQLGVSLVSTSQTYKSIYAEVIQIYLDE